VIDGRAQVHLKSEICVTRRIDAVASKGQCAADDCSEMQPADFRAPQRKSRARVFACSRATGCSDAVWCMWI
jgi:hypothetical protein